MRRKVILRHVQWRNLIIWVFGAHKQTFMRSDKEKLKICRLDGSEEPKMVDAWIWGLIHVRRGTALRDPWQLPKTTLIEGKFFFKAT